MQEPGNPQSDRKDTSIGEQLSGYLDGELTQQQRQRVERHLEECETSRALYDELVEIRTRLGQGLRREFGEDVFRESFDEPGNRWLARIGWAAIVAGIVGLGIVLLGGFLMDNSVSTGMKLLIALPYLGFGALFIAVLRRRLKEARSDKYKDVEI